MEEANRKLRHCYEQSKRKTKTKPDWRGNEKNKGKYDIKKARPRDIGKKENAAPPRRFNASDRGHGHRYEEHNKEPMQCWTCGGDHRMRDCP